MFAPKSHQPVSKIKTWKVHTGKTVKDFEGLKVLTKFFIQFIEYPEPYSQMD